MSKIKYTSIKPGLVFEHEGVKLEAVEVENSSSCNGCFVIEDDDFTGSCLPCSNISELHPCLKNNKQKHNLIFKKVEDEK